jgi:asparagine synthase (glutamine-hydrolysing)
LFFADSGAQPLVNDDETLALAVNGEIYNHRILRKNLNTKYNFKTHSDCEVIIPLVCSSTISPTKAIAYNSSVYGAWH